jgi:hypothetical protein
MRKSATANSERRPNAAGMPDLVVVPATRNRDHPVPGVRQAARKALRAHAPPDRVGPPRPST